KAGVVVFPGSNCDHDTFYALNEILDVDVEFIWHKEDKINNFDFIFLPGGFSYGDYLRSGAIARFSPLMNDLIKKGKDGLPVLGICNGFQVLTEAHLLPGALMRNTNLRFICKHVNIRLEKNSSYLFKNLPAGSMYKIPIAHGEGCYHIDDDGLKKLQDNGQIVFKYVNEDNEPDSDANPNGSIESIAGICNEKGNIIGMMPHPERAIEEIIKSADGKLILEAMLNTAM
ncbi:MAG: phosphoribosylformylglycinamidine synthase subunit PurQ, partial [Calditrichia bacterium]|nr:phosphoribosylformylglycinamidine synthase subunit PurQ [Calditrichia bacterium]